MPVPSVLSDLFVSEASNSPADTETVTATTRPSDYMRAQAALLRRLRAQGAAVASAATVDLGAITDGEYIHITGTVTITSFGTIAAGIERTVVFDAALTLTHNATSLILPGGANITTAAGDVAVFVSEGAGNWRCKDYQLGATAPGSVKDGSVTTAKIADGAVTNAKIAGGAVTTGNIADLNVTTAKIADGAITAVKAAGITLLAEMTTTALATSIQFTGLDITVHKGYRIEIEYVNGTATGHDTAMYVNGLTTATDYYMQRIFGDGTTTTSDRTNAASVLSVSASERTAVTIDLSLAPGGYALANSAFARDVGAAIKIFMHAWSRTASVANITSLTFTAGVSDGIGIGTTIKIYRKDK